MWIKIVTAVEMLLQLRGDLYLSLSPAFKKLDPLKHMSRIEAEIDDIDDDVTDAVPYEEIKDSAAYVRELRKLRKITWR